MEVSFGSLQVYGIQFNGEPLYIPKWQNRPKQKKRKLGCGFISVIGAIFKTHHDMLTNFKQNN